MACGKPEAVHDCEQQHPDLNPFCRVSSFDVEIPFHEDRVEVVKNEQPKGSDAQQVEIAAALIETGGGHGRRPVCAKYRRSYGGQRLVGLCQCKCTGRALSDQHGARRRCSAHHKVRRRRF